MSNEKVRTGLWKREGTNGGPSSYSGKVTIEGVEYFADVYKNDRKETDKHPDLNLILKPRGAPKQTQQEAPRDAGFGDDIPDF